MGTFEREQGQKLDSDRDCAIDLQCGRSIPCHATEVRFQCCPDDVAPGSGLSLVFRTVAIMLSGTRPKVARGRSGCLRWAVDSCKVVSLCTKSRTQWRRRGVEIPQYSPCRKACRVRRPGYRERSSRDLGRASSALDKSKVRFASNPACDSNFDISNLSCWEYFAPLTPCHPSARPCRAPFPCGRPTLSDPPSPHLLPRLAFPYS